MNLQVFNAPLAWRLKLGQSKSASPDLRQDDPGPLPPSVDPAIIKISLEQVNKRLDSLLALKTSTETRAITLAGQCTSLLSVLIGAVMWEFVHDHQPLLIAAGSVAAACLYFAVREAYDCIAPRQRNMLPGLRLEALWPEMKEPNMAEPEFMTRIMRVKQQAIVENEQNQEKRATQLERAVRWVQRSMPLAVIAVVAVEVTGRFLAELGPFVSRFSSF